MTEIINWIVNNWDSIAIAITSIVGTASIIVKLTPTLKDDAFMKPIVRFVGKYIALNRK